MAEEQIDNGLSLLWEKVLADRCNILFIMADQFRHDALFHTGGIGRTHALDELAAEGVSFRHAVTNSPECMPARFALATGLYPHQTGVWRNAVATLSPSVWNWTQSLASAGYQTSVFGKTHFHECAQPSGDLRDGVELLKGYGFIDGDEIAGPRASMRMRTAMTESWDRLGLWDDYRRDFEERFAGNAWAVRPSPLGLEHYYDTYVGRRARDYLSSYDRPEPWFCWVSFAGPHEPWDAPAPYDKLHSPLDMHKAIPRMSESGAARSLLGDAFTNPEKAAPQDEGDISALRANYAGNVTLIDDQIAKIMELLKSTSAYENTLILFTSDHGEMNGDHGLLYKGNFLSSAVDIPFIVRPPHGRVAKRDSLPDTLVELVDAGSTILDYAGIPQPYASNGRSLRPLIEGETDCHRQYVASEFANNTMIATRFWKCEFDMNNEPVLLFDLVSDRDEQFNLIGQSRLDQVVTSLRTILSAHRAKASGRYNITVETNE